VIRYEFDFEYSQALVRAAARQHLRHHLTWRQWATLAAFVALIAAVCLSTEEGYWCGLLQGMLALLLFAVVMGQISARDVALRFARKLPTPKARCMLTDEAMTVENALALSSVKWPLVQSVVRGPEVWLFFFAREQFFALPADKLVGEAAAFVESRVTAAGGKML
jgi:hypothetical protein